jgi:hypothetical protein
MTSRSLRGGSNFAGVCTVDLTPHRGNAEADEEREHESDRAESELRHIVVLIALERTEALACERSL